MRPSMAETFPAMLSMSMPMVMREGKALGLMMMSGVMPDSEKGMSIWGQSTLRTPFCPWREENLSPMIGLRT